MGGLIKTHVSSSENPATIQSEVPGNLVRSLPDTWGSEECSGGGGKGAKGIEERRRRRLSKPEIGVDH